MKKRLLSAAAVLVSASMLNIPAFAADDSVSVYISLTKGESIVAVREINVTDTDGDDEITVKDVLSCAHKQFYSGGSSGFSFKTTDDIVSITKLWGSSGGKYGCYVNNVAVESLDETVDDGDYVDAFVFSDKRLSDIYCYFGENVVETEAGEEIILTLTGSYYDEDMELTEDYIEGADILVDGKSIGVRTNEDGEAVFAISQTGTFVLSARSGDRILVPHVCTVIVSEGDGSDDDDDGTDDDEEDDDDAVGDDDETDDDADYSDNDNDGHGGSSGWDLVVSLIKSTEEGKTITLDMNGGTEVPERVVSALRGKDIYLKLIMNSSTVWRIHGTTVTSPKTLDLRVSYGTDLISKDLANAVKNKSGYSQFSLSHNGDFGASLSLEMLLGEQFNGKYANLFYCSSDKKSLVYTGTDIIKNGKAVMKFTHASDWLITISSTPYTGEAQIFASGTQKPASESSENDVQKEEDTGVKLDDEEDGDNGNGNDGIEDDTVMFSDDTTPDDGQINPNTGAGVLLVLPAAAGVSLLLAKKRERRRGKK